MASPAENVESDVRTNSGLVPPNFGPGTSKVVPCDVCPSRCRELPSDVGASNR